MFVDVVVAAVIVETSADALAAQLVLVLDNYEWSKFNLTYRFPSTLNSRIMFKMAYIKC